MFVLLNYKESIFFFQKNNKNKEAEIRVREIWNLKSRMIIR